MFFKIPCSTPASKSSPASSPLTEGECSSKPALDLRPAITSLPKSAAAFTACPAFDPLRPSIKPPIRFSAAALKSLTLSLIPCTTLLITVLMASLTLKSLFIMPSLSSSSMSKPKGVNSTSHCVMACITASIK